MDTEAAHSAITIGLGAGVGAVCRFLMLSGLHGRWVSVGAALVAAVFIAVRAYDAADFVRGNVTTYLLGYVELLGIAAGTLKMAEVAQDKITEMRGTGDGRN